jgi:hypothetical protein
MTPEEYQRAMAEAMRRQQMGLPPVTTESQIMAGTTAPMKAGTAGFGDAGGVPSIPPVNTDPRAQDFTGRENSIKQQRAMAAEMMGRAAPRGQQVGTGKWAYNAGPNWGDQVGNVGAKLMGGYMAGKANEDDADLDVRRGLAKAALLETDDSRYATDEKRKDDTLAEAIRSNIAGEAADIATIEQRIDSDAKTLAVSQGRENRLSEGEWDTSTVKLPDGSNGTVAFNPLKGIYKFGSSEGKTLTPAEATKLLTFDTTVAKLPASMQKDLADRRKVTYSLTDSIAEIERLESEGKDTSGVRGLVMSFVPEKFKGVAQNALFDKDEQKQIAKNVYIDAQVKEAISTGVLSDQDVTRLAGLNVAAGGLTPEQQVVRLKAVTEIMGLYGLELDLSGDIPNKDGGLKDTSEMTLEELQDELKGQG